MGPGLFVMKIDAAATSIVIVGKEKLECQNIVKLINEKKYSGITLKSISALEKTLSQEECMAVLIDIDTVPVENRELRELTLKYPESSFLCMSNEKYHPELRKPFATTYMLVSINP